VFRNKLPIVGAFGVLVWACAPAFADTPAPDRTAPPQIYHTRTTIFCARLHDHVRPAVGMILQNDQQIAQSPPLFSKYMRGTLAAQDPVAGNFSNGAPPAGDSIYNQSPETRMALQQMSYLVSPIAQNIIAAQKALTDEKMQASTGNPTDDAKLQKIKNQLMETIAFQSASLDLINGFVTTQQMGDLQHAGTEYLSQMEGYDSTAQITRQTPNPYQDPNTPGLPQNPYDFDPTSIPGLIVGYNPLSRIVDAMHWLKTETTKREDAVASNIDAALAACNKLQ
jgi:hypothetical protein